MALSLSIDTKEKRNLAILLGLMAALIVGVLVIYVVLPALSGGGDSAQVASVPKPSEPADAPGAGDKGPDAAGAAPGGPAPGGAVAGAAAPATGASATTTTAMTMSSQRIAMPFGRPREDPFEPHFVRIPAPPINYDEKKVAPPPPPIPVPQPGNLFVAPLPMPGAGGATTMVGMPHPPVFTTLPPVQIPQLVTTPSVPRFQGGIQQMGVVGRAASRRVSGVLIGDSVRAILEIGDGMQKVTRIVQPGDEVDGIKILRIERIREGGRVITRMIISEAGQERFVELSPSAERPVDMGQGGAGTGGGGITFTAPPAGGGNPFGAPRGDF